MNEIFTLLIGVAVLILGWPIGMLLANATKEELKSGKKWFGLIVLLGIIGGFVGLILKNDIILFTGFFIAIVVSRSIKG